MRYVKGNLLEAKEKVIGHGCNAQGVMGSGVAKAIIEKWPEVYIQYRIDFKYGYLTLGSCVDVHDVGEDEKIILNLITQDYFGTDKRHVNYAAIVSSLCHWVDTFITDHLKYNGWEDKLELPKDLPKMEIALPKIGAGLGGGDWNIIEILLEDIEKMYNKHFPNGFEFVIYEL